MSEDDTSVAEQEMEQIRGNVLARLKRIEGQVRGIHRMVSEGKKCEDILVQVRAVRNALQSANGLIMRRYLLQCHLTALRENGSHGKALEEALKTLTTYMDH